MAMGRGWTHISAVGGNWIIAFFGGVYLAVGIGQIFLVAIRGESLLTELLNFTIVAVPSLALI